MAMQLSVFNINSNRVLDTYHMTYRIVNYVGQKAVIYIDVYDLSCAFTPRNLLTGERERERA